MLAMAAIAIPLQQRRSELAALTDQVATTRVVAEKRLALRERLDQLTVFFLSVEMGRFPKASQILGELTRLVPDQAYLAQLVIWSAGTSRLIESDLVAAEPAVGGER
jgi:hypothetical protein